MSIIVSDGYALARLNEPDPNKPVVGIENLATASNITADHEVSEYPVTNLVSEATNDAECWRSDSTDAQNITVLFDQERDVDHVSFAGHNLGSGEIEVTILGLPHGGDPDDPGDWVELVEPARPAGDLVHMSIFERTPLIGVRVALQPDAVPPRAAVMYVGRLVRFQKGVQAGHTPIIYGRQFDVENVVSTSGQFLGRVITGGRTATSARIIKLTPDWCRQVLDPFLSEAVRRPFFWAWRPMAYPAEVGFAWLTNQPVPVPDLSGFIDITLDMEGLL